VCLNSTKGEEKGGRKGTRRTPSSISRGEKKRRKVTKRGRGGKKREAPAALATKPERKEGKEGGFYFPAEDVVEGGKKGKGKQPPEGKEEGTGGSLIPRNDVELRGGGEGGRYTEHVPEDWQEEKKKERGGDP